MAVRRDDGFVQSASGIHRLPLPWSHRQRQWWSTSHQLLQRSSVRACLLARAAREAILRAHGCSAGIGVGHSRVVARWATRRAKPSGDGVHFTPLERVLEALRLSTVQLQNTFGTTLGARIAAMVRDYHLGGNNYSFDALQAYCFGINIKL